MRKLLPFVLLGAAVAPMGASAMHPVASPLVIAHRGGALIAPENTIAAFEAAVAAGSDLIELDTRQTADGEIVVMHDATLDRTTFCSGPVSQKSTAEVTACDASRGWPAYTGDPKARVPTIAQVVRFMLDNPGLRADIEVASYPQEPGFEPASSDHVARLMQETKSVRSLVTIQSFLPLYLEQAKRIDHSQSVALTTSFSAGTAFQPAHNGLLYVSARGLEIAQPDHRSPDLSESYVSAAHAAGKLVYVWTVNPSGDDNSRFVEMVRLGVDGIMTDRPDILVALLSRG